MFPVGSSIEQQEDGELWSTKKTCPIGSSPSSSSYPCSDCKLQLATIRSHSRLQPTGVSQAKSGLRRRNSTCVSSNSTCSFFLFVYNIWPLNVPWIFRGGYIVISLGRKWRIGGTPHAEGAFALCRWTVHLCRKICQLWHSQRSLWELSAWSLSLPQFLYHLRKGSHYGHQKCAVTISTNNFGGDPCPNIKKRVAVEARLSI